MKNFLSGAWHTLTGKYFVDVTVSDPESGVTTHVYLKTCDKGKTDFTKDPKQACDFGYATGALMVRELKKHGIDASLVTVEDALFIYDVTFGNASGNESGVIANTSDHAKDALEEKIIGYPGVFAIGTHYTKCTALCKHKKGRCSVEPYIRIIVGDENAMQFVESFIDGDSFMGYKVQIIYGNPIKAQ